MHIITLIFAALIFLPGFWVKYTLGRYSKPLEYLPGTGAELVSHLQKKFSLDLTLEETDKGDHYDPESKTIRLSHNNLEIKSLTAVATATHEFGHALQDHRNEAMLKLRTRLAKNTVTISAIGSGLLILTPVIMVLTRSPAVGFFLMGGVLLSAFTNTLIHLITLPVEWDASFAKALPILESGNYLETKDLKIVKRILLACALTYAAQSILSVLSMRNLFLILRR